MATVTVTRGGKPVKGAEIKAVSTFGFSQYDQKCFTDSDGVARLDNNENRFRILVNGNEADLVPRLRGDIEVEL